jgi:hypothetical protein
MNLQLLRSQVLWVGEDASAQQFNGANGLQLNAVTGMNTSSEQTAVDISKYMDTMKMVKIIVSLRSGVERRKNKDAQMTKKS